VSDSGALFGARAQLRRETIRRMLLISSKVCSWSCLGLLATNVTFAKSYS
jgi:hypothetical protein